MKDGFHMVSNAKKGQAAILLFTCGVSLVAIVFLHQPQWSLQDVIIGQKTWTIPEMALLKLSVGFLTSLAVLAICRLVVRRLSYESIAVAVLVQILWIEFEWRFSIRAADFGELMIRFAEEFGTILLGVLLVGFLEIRKRKSASLT
jgi:hypothetical protein